MSDLMKKVFNDKRYQFGYNDAMDVAFNSERELKAKVDALEGLCAITGVIEREKKYIAAQAKVEELTTGIRAHIEWADPFNCDDLEILIGDMQEVKGES